MCSVCRKLENVIIVINNSLYPCGYFLFKKHHLIESHKDCPISELTCQHCCCKMDNDTEILILHSKSCARAIRLDKSYFYVCLFCKYHTYCSDHMRSHIRSHTGDRPFACPFCQYTCSRKGHLKSHMNIKHGP